MRQAPRAHYRRVDRGLGKAVLKGLTTVFMGPARIGMFNPPLYPRDAQARDLERIGGDMYAGFEAFGQERGRSASEAAPIETEDPVEGGKLPPAEVLKRLPESVRAAVVESAACPGPLPPPTMYREYDEVLPGSADRILRMAEKEQAHRIGWEDEALHQASQHGDLGLWSGFLIAVFALLTAGLVAINGHDLVAGIIGCTGIAGAVAGLVHERRGQRRFLG